MSYFIKFALLMGAASLALASVIPCGNQIILEAVGGRFAGPSGLWQIYQNDTKQSTNLFPSAPNGDAVFTVSQGAGATKKLDLVASFTGLPAGQGPYQVEFQYSPKGQYSSGGGTDQIEVFAITRPLPSSPTWAIVQQLTGSQIGTFNLPKKEEQGQSKKIFINSVAYQSTLSFRFSLTSSSSKDGFVRYTQNANSNVPGLGIEYGG